MHAVVCGFCHRGKEQLTTDEVLISSPDAKAMICNRCVAVCQGLAAKWQRSKGYQLISVEESQT